MGNLWRRSRADVYARRSYICIYIYIYDFSYRETALIQAGSPRVSPTDVPTRLRFFLPLPSSCSSFFRFHTFRISSERYQRDALSRIFIYSSSVSYFRLELSRFTGLAVTRARRLPRYWIMFSDPTPAPSSPVLPVEMRIARHHIRIVPRGRPISIPAVKTRRVVRRIFSTGASQKIPSPRCFLPVGARSYHPQAFDFNIAASGMNFYARTLVGRRSGPTGTLHAPRRNSTFEISEHARARA